MIESVFDNQKVHEFNRITTLPRQGGAQGESAVTPTRNATYIRATTSLKVIRRKGAVTGFLQDASSKQLDALAAEMENHLLAHVYDLDYYTLWGNELGNVFEYGGWDRFISSFRQTRATGQQVPSDLRFLDDLIDNNSRKQGSKHRKAFLMSPEMLSFVSRLLTNVRLNQGLSGSGLSEIEIPGGWRMASYRGVPIIETTATRPIKSMTTVTATDFTSGGSLPDDASCRNPVTATYIRATTSLKVIRRKGAVTGFLQDASSKQLDALAAEMENHLLAHVYDLDYYTLWGNELGNVFEYGGWDRFISSFRQTRATGQQVPSDLRFLDDLIDNNSRKQGSKHRKAFLMSPEMLSFVSRLLTNTDSTIACIGYDRISV